MPLTAGGLPTSEFIVTAPTKINFGRNKKVPLKLIFGNNDPTHQGTVAGIGIEMGGRKNLLRMDYHDPHNDRGNNSSGIRNDEIAVPNDGNFHYHIMKW